MKLTARIISKVFLLDGRQVLFHISFNILEALRKTLREKEGIYIRFELENEVTKETSYERKRAPCEHGRRLLCMWSIPHMKNSS